MALLREAGYERPIHLHGALEKLTGYYKAARHPPRRHAEGRGGGARKTRRRNRDLPALGHQGRLGPKISRPRCGRRFGLDAGARAGAAEGCGIAADRLRPRRLGGDSARRWSRPAARNSGSPMARPRRWSTGPRDRGSTPGRSTSSATATRPRTSLSRSRMKAFAELLDRLAFEPGRNNKIRLIKAYFEGTPDPERGVALAALTDSNSSSPTPSRRCCMRSWPSGPIRCCSGCPIITSATCRRRSSLIWPARPSEVARAPTLSEVVADPVDDRQGRAAAGHRRLARRARRDRPLGAAEAHHRQLAGRRLGPARQDRGRGARAARARRHRGGVARPESRPMRNSSPMRPDRGPKPDTVDPDAVPHPRCWRTPIDEAEGFRGARASADFAAEWKWDGIRVQAVTGFEPDGRARGPSLLAQRRRHLRQLSRI